MPAGRKPLSIADQVDRLEGSPVAKERLRVILANLAGQMSVSEACTALGIDDSWFFELKHKSLEHWVGAMEPGSPGRRPATAMTPEQERVADLEAQVRRLELELKAAQLREELARASSSAPNVEEERGGKKPRR
jgi:transposase-like protein